MDINLSDKEVRILILSICMSAVEGGYAYDHGTSDDDIRALLGKLGANEEIIESAGEYGFRDL